MAKVILPRTNIVRSFNPTRPPTPQAPVSQDPKPVSQEHSERVLLLEDEAQTNFILREYLGSLGYKVVAVANGVDGLREVMTSDFELVICDMMMPKLPGDMFYLAVQKTRPQLCNRFVFITGHQENPAVDAFIERTHSAILVKPFRLQQLEVTLESILSRFPKKLHPISHSPEEEAQAEQAAINVPQHSAPAAPAEEKQGQSMMSKALQMVGLIRNGNTTAPVAPASAAPQNGQKPRITRKVSQEDSSKVTRRIAHLANTPVSQGAQNPVSTPRITRRIPPATLPPTGAITKSAEPAGPKVTRRIPAPAAALPTAAPAPRVTRRIPAPPAAEAPTPRVTRRIPAPTHSTPATAAPAQAPTPRVTRRIPAPAADSPQTAAPVGALTAPRTSPSAPKVTRTVRVPNRDAVPPQPTIPAPTIGKSTRKVAAPIPTPVEKPTAKVSKPASAPVEKPTAKPAKTPVRKVKLAEVPSKGTRTLKKPEAAPASKKPTAKKSK
jgi:DNA-binding response OmpR family regulator